MSYLVFALRNRRVMEFCLTIKMWHMCAILFVPYALLTWYGVMLCRENIRSGAGIRKDLQPTLLFASVSIALFVGALVSKQL